MCSILDHLNWYHFISHWHIDAHWYMLHIGIILYYPQLISYHTWSMLILWFTSFWEGGSQEAALRPAPSAHEIGARGDPHGSGPEETVESRDGVDSTQEQTGGPISRPLTGPLKPSLNPVWFGFLCEDFVVKHMLTWPLRTLIQLKAKNTEHTGFAEEHVVQLCCSVFFSLRRFLWRVWRTFPCQAGPFEKRETRFNMENTW